MKAKSQSQFGQMLAAKRKSSANNENCALKPEADKHVLPAFSKPDVCILTIDPTK